jgi:hypothetical protein
VPVVPLYPLPWRNPWDLPSSRLCRGDVPRSSTPMGSRGPWPSAPLIWPSVLLTTSAPTINRSSRGSIPSRLRIAAHHLPVYASSLSLPSTTQHAVPGAWPGLPGSGPAPDWQSRAWLGALAMDQKLTLSNLLSRMPLIYGEFFNKVAKALLLLFVPKAHEVGVFGSLILARVLERLLS